MKRLAHAVLLAVVLASFVRAQTTTGGGGKGGGGGAPAFSAITTGANTTAIMTVGAGATLNGSTTGIFDMSALTSGNNYKIPVIAGATSTSNGAMSYDSTLNIFHGGLNGADSKFASFTVTPTANNDCVVWSVIASNILLSDPSGNCTISGAGTLTLAGAIVFSSSGALSITTSSAAAGIVLQIATGNNNGQTTGNVKITTGQSLGITGVLGTGSIFNQPGPMTGITIAGNTSGDSFNAGADQTNAAAAGIPGAGILRAGQTTNPAGTPGLLNVAENYLGTPAQWTVVCGNGTTPDSVVACPLAGTPVNILGVSTNAAAPLTIMRTGDVPINATAAVTVGDAVYSATSGTAGFVTDCGAGACLGTQIGIVRRVAGTVRVASGATTTTATLSTTLPLVELTFGGVGGATVGTPTNNNALAGMVGEYITATLATGSSLSITTNTPLNITSISLTAGDWDVWGVVDYTAGATTSITNLRQGISTTSATLGAQDTFTSFSTAAEIPTAAIDAAWNTPVVRISVGSTTTVFLVSEATFTVSTLKGYGSIFARRVR